MTEEKRQNFYKTMREEVSTNLTHYSINAICEYCQDCEDSEEIEIIQDAIVESGNPEWMFKFASKVSDVNIPFLQTGVISSGHGEWIFKFAKHIEGNTIY